VGASPGVSARADPHQRAPRREARGPPRSPLPRTAYLATRSPGTERARADGGERQEGTGRGDAERLSTRTSSEGVNSVARNGRESRGAIYGVCFRETRRTSDRQRGATNPRHQGGASRQGSAKLRRRNGSERVAPFARRSREAPGVDTTVHVGGDDPMTEPTRGGFASPARRESSEEGVKRRRPRRAGPATDLGRGAARKDLEGAAGDGGTPGRERGGQRTATGMQRYERNTAASQTSNRRPTSREQQRKLTRSGARYSEGRRYHRSR
jgi:hypothetical protein